MNAYTLMGIGIFILSGLGFLLIRRRSFRKRAVQTKGTIVKLTQRGKNYYPTVEFTANDGNLYRVGSNVGTHPPIGRVGSIVTIYYDPQNPEKISLPMSCADWILIPIFTFIGLLCLSIGIKLFPMP